MGLDYVDLYLIHWPVYYKPNNKRDPNDLDHWFNGLNNTTLIPYSDEFFAKTWKALEKLVKKGLTKHIGLSNFSQSKIQNILNICEIHPAVLQIELHPGII